MVTAFEARYPGRCADCTGPIDAGAHVTYVDDQLVHLACASAGLWQGSRPALTEPDICERCWTARATNGACACEED